MGAAIEGITGGDKKAHQHTWYWELGRPFLKFSAHGAHLLFMSIALIFGNGTGIGVLDLAFWYL